MDERSFRETELGKAFQTFENATARAWQKDTEAGFSDSYAKDMAAEKAWDTQREARFAFLSLLMALGECG